MGTTHYLTTSEGEKENNPRWYRRAEGLLHKHNQTIARRKKGSKRWQKAVHTTALHHERTANQRKDFIGKLVYKLYHHYKNNVLVAEDLRISNMVKNKHLSKSISDASWATFFEWAGNIAERDGFHFHQVNPKNTSQICSRCGQKAPKKLSLSVRTYNCQSCGNSMDRDHNAAQNILFKAAAAFRGERWVTTLYETRNKNEARDAGLQGAIQLSLFDALIKPKSLGLGSSQTASAHTPSRHISARNSITPEFTPNSTYGSKTGLHTDTPSSSGKSVSTILIPLAVKAKPHSYPSKSSENSWAWHPMMYIQHSNL